MLSNASLGSYSLTKSLKIFKELQKKAGTTSIQPFDKGVDGMCQSTATTHLTAPFS